jgi:hypothetical protein
MADTPFLSFWRVVFVSELLKKLTLCLSALGNMGKLTRELATKGVL